MQLFLQNWCCLFKRSLKICWKTSWPSIKFNVINLSMCLTLAYKALWTQYIAWSTYICPKACDHSRLIVFALEHSFVIGQCSDVWGGVSFSGIWWLFVFGMGCLWRHNLTSYSCFETNGLSKFVDTICIFFHTHCPYFIKYQPSKLGYWRKIHSTLWHNCKNIRLRVKTGE